MALAMLLLNLAKSLPPPTTISILPYLLSVPSTVLLSQILTSYFCRGKVCTRHFKPNDLHLLKKYPIEGALQSCEMSNLLHGAKSLI